MLSARAKNREHEFRLSRLRQSCMNADHARTYSAYMIDTIVFLKPEKPLSSMRKTPRPLDFLTLKPQLVRALAKSPGPLQRLQPGALQ